MKNYRSILVTTLILLAVDASAIELETRQWVNEKNISDPEFIPVKTQVITDQNNNYSKYTTEYGNKLSNIDIIQLSNTKNHIPKRLDVSNSGGQPETKNTNGGTNGATDDDDKTLSQQVADGKYGLIQHEIFTEKIARPGIISYDINPEVPKDNINNLGGLEPDDIWLAENHLLVLSGGGFSNGDSAWKPIDDYIAPKRPVKLPPNPKVPPPFPVQLFDGGATEYVKGVNATLPSIPFIPFIPPFSQDGKPPNFQNPSSPYGNFPNLPYGLPGNFTPNGIPLVPFIRPLYPNNARLPPRPPAPPSIYYQPPPAAEFIPPFGNISDSFDEDDPSMFYPPPYDFYYATDNTTRVPAGPLVPGIILPPPPDFFAPLTNKSKENEKPSTTYKQPTKETKYPEKSGKQLSLSNESWTYNNIKEPAYHKPTMKPASYVTPASYGTTADSPQTTPLVNYNVINEVTHPGADNQITYADIVANKINTEDSREGWMPIPAPKPYYITGPKKLVKDAIVMVETPRDENTPNRGYVYKPPRVRYNYDSTLGTSSFPNSRQTIRHKNPSSTSSYFPKFSEFYTTQSPLFEPTSGVVQNDWRSTTAVASANMYHPPIHNGGNSVQATYYFYEEPRDIPSHIPQYTNAPDSTTSIPVGPLKTPAEFIQNYNRPFKTTIPRFPGVITNQYVPELTSTTRSTNRIRSKDRRPKTPILPIYYLAQLDQLPEIPTSTSRPYTEQYYPSIPTSTNAPYKQEYNPGIPTSTNIPYTTNIPYKHIYNPGISFVSTTPRPTYNINKPNPFKPTSRPIFEYSYTASGYDGSNSQIHVPESKPNQDPHYQQVYDYQPYYQPSYQPAYTGQDLIYQIQLPVQTTSNTLGVFDQHPYYTSDRDKYVPMRSKSPPFHRGKYVPTRSKNPNTNTIPNYVTTETTWDQVYQTENPFYAYFTKDDEELIDDNTKKYFALFGQKIKRKPVGEDEVQNTNRYITDRTKETYPSVRSRKNRGRYKPRNEATILPDSSDQNNEIIDSEATTVSLEGDTRVNYINPSPTINPDAEYIGANNIDDDDTDSTHPPENNYILQSAEENNSEENNLVKYKNRPSTNQKYQFQDELEENENSSEEAKQSVPFRTKSNHISLHKDIAVNFRKRRPAINANAEILNLKQGSSNPNRVAAFRVPQSNRNRENYYEAETSGRESVHRKPHYQRRPVSLARDTLVNYRNPRPPLNPDAEYINSDQSVEQESNRRFASYILPDPKNSFYQARNYQQLEDNYNFQLDVEKPARYYKRVPQSSSKRNIENDVRR